MTFTLRLDEAEILEVVVAEIARRLRCEATVAKAALFEDPDSGALRFEVVCTQAEGLVPTP